jgi:hypothetical protein
VKDDDDEKLGMEHVAQPTGQAGSTLALKQTLDSGEMLTIALSFPIVDNEDTL